jgi:hypothetical protein
VPHGANGKRPSHRPQIPADPDRPELPAAAPHCRPAETSKGASGVLFDETETPRFIDAVRKIKEEQRKNERKTREAKEKVKRARRKSTER